MILVVGATGFLGGEICRLLTRVQTDTVRAMVRETADPGMISLLRAMNLELVTGDLRDLESLEDLIKDVDVVITTASAMPYSYIPGENSLEMVDRNGMLNLVNMAVQYGVKHFIYTSFSKNISSDFPLKRVKREVESLLQKCGINYTILRPGYFMEAWLTSVVGFDVENSKVQVLGDGTNPVSYVSLFDVAKFAVQSLTNPFAKNAILEIGGPEKLSQLDAVRIFEDTIGHPFKVHNLSLEAIRSNMESAEDPVEKSFAGLMYCLAKGDPIDMEEVLVTFPIKLRTVRDYSRSVLAEA
jgi:NADH dehydrogenase